MKGGIHLMNEIKRIRRSVESILGKKVHLTTNVGRNTFVEAQGVITSAYPNLFTVTLEDGQNNDQVISYTYSDVLTSTVVVKII